MIFLYTTMIIPGNTHSPVQECVFPGIIIVVYRNIISVYNDDNPREYTFSGTRIKRGLYQTSKGMHLNADVNGALNILKKSNVADLSVLYARGQVDSPLRIRIA